MRLLVIVGALLTASCASSLKTMHWEHDWDEAQPVQFEFRVDGGAWMPTTPEQAGDLFAQPVALPRHARVEIRSCDATGACSDPAPARVSRH